MTESPFRTASLYDLTRHHPLRAREVPESWGHAAESLLLAPTVVRDRPAPDFIYGSVPDHEVAYFRGQHWTPDISIFGLRDVTVIGPWFASGTLLVQDGVRLSCNEIAMSPQDGPAMERFEENERERIAGNRTIRIIDEPVVLIGNNGHQIYGHWLADFLPKFHLLTMAGISLRDVRILLPANMPSFPAALMRCMGLTDAQFLPYNPDTEMLLCRSLLVPTTPRASGRCHPIFAECAATINRMIDRTGLVRESDTPRRIYIARPPHAARGITGSERAERLALDHGFTLVRPELLSIPEQIALFRNAREVIGPYGSALHATLFSRPGVRVGAIHGQRPWAFDGLQSGIGEYLGQQTGYIFAGQDPEDASRMVFEEEPFRQCLREQFSHLVPELPPAAQQRAMRRTLAVWQPDPAQSFPVWTEEKTAGPGPQNPDAPSSWWQTDFGAPRQLEELRIFSDGGPVSVTLATSLDGEDWSSQKLSASTNPVFSEPDRSPFCWQPPGGTLIARYVLILATGQEPLLPARIELSGSTLCRTGPLSALLPEALFVPDES